MLSVELVKSSDSVSGSEIVHRRSDGNDGARDIDAELGQEMVIRPLVPRWPFSSLWGYRRWRGL
jgi:hypothetical protein